MTMNAAVRSRSILSTLALPALFGLPTLFGLIAIGATARTTVAQDAPQIGQPNPPRPMYAYVGTFSSPLQDTLPTQVDLPPGNGRGIHIFRVDRETGAWSEAGIVRMGNSPSHLAINADGSRLYSANETDRVDSIVGHPQMQGTISTFKINHESGQLTLMGTVPSGGAGPTYVSLHPCGKYLLVANYFGGSVAVLPINDDGIAAEPCDVQRPEGEIGPTKATHAPPGSFAISGHDRTHAHMIQADASGAFVMHVDLGLDKIFIWKFDAEHGKLLPADQPFVSLPPGDGPRHFDFHPNGQWFYSIQEEGSTVVKFDFDRQHRTLTERQTISTLPTGFAGSNFCSEILVSLDGRYLYAGNRLHDSIALFKIDDKGTLTYQEEVWTQGNYPRSFEIEPQGRFLYCCNQRSDNIATFAVDKETGRLEFTGQFIPVGNPSCIIFLGMDP